MTARLKFLFLRTGGFSLDVRERFGDLGDL